jgi:hypothetical protein
MYAVMFEVERDELIYDTGKDAFTAMDEPIVFNTKEEAEKRATKWNTGRVVPYIKPMTNDERQASVQRGERNDN